MKNKVQLADTDNIEKCLYLVIMLDDVFKTNTLFCSDKSRISMGENSFSNIKIIKSYDAFYKKRFNTFFGLNYDDWAGKKVLELAEVIKPDFIPQNKLPENDHWLGIVKVYNNQMEKGLSWILGYKEQYELQVGHLLMNQQANSDKVEGITKYNNKVREELMMTYWVTTTEGKTFEFKNGLELYSWILCLIMDIE